MKQKKGLSTVVTSLILILLVLVAIGLIWLVIRNLVEEGSGQIEIGTKCLQIDIRATAVTCASSSDCNVTLTRRSGGDDIGGVVLVFENDTQETTAAPIDVPGDIEVLTSATETGVDSKITSPTKVKVTAYIKDSAGEPQYCSTTEFSF
jgi:hypothetical protein